MDTVVPLLEMLNSLSPLAVIALLGVVIFMLVRDRKASDIKHEVITGNHLHDLPEAVETLKRIENTLQRIEVKLGEDFSYLKARINGKS